MGVDGVMFLFLFEVEVLVCIFASSVFVVLALIMVGECDEGCIAVVFVSMLEFIP